MSVLSAILTQAWRITHDIAGMRRRMIERRCKKAHQVIRLVYQNPVGGFHGAADTCGRGVGHHSPGLRDGIDAGLLICMGTQGSAAVEKPAKIPIAIPAEKFDRIS